MAKKHPKDPGFWKIKRSRNGREHIDNCSTGYYQDSSDCSQIHHIVCISSMQDSYIYDQVKDDSALMIVRKSLMATEWNINDGHNNIGLPLKRAFVSRSPKKWGGLPCHQVDHNHYTDNLNIDLNKKVWQTIVEEAEECNVYYKDIKEQLKARSEHWRTFLKNRGSGGDNKSTGTKHCWRNRHNLPESWYIPFSMHPGTPPKKRPPPSWDDLSKGLKDALKKMLKSL